jgi:carbamoyltransferase
MQANLNLKIKYRESFRPFAPSVLAEKVGDYFELDRESPYMRLVTPVNVSRRRPFQREGTDLTALARVPRSDLPAVTHVDDSARVQTVVRHDHPPYHGVLKAFERLTGCALIANTSFNVRGEPIVCTPDDAYRCFMRTEMDYLVMGNFLLDKRSQPPWRETRCRIEGSERGDGDTHDRGFADAVSSAFLTDFLPAVSSLSRGSLRVSTAFLKRPTTWTAVPRTADRKALFTIPPALDGGAPDPVRTAAAITSFWEPGPATEAMRRVLVRLLEITLEFPERREQDARVGRTLDVVY